MLVPGSYATPVKSDDYGKVSAIRQDDRLELEGEQDEHEAADREKDRWALVTLRAMQKLRE